MSLILRAVSRILEQCPHLRLGGEVRGGHATTLIGSQPTPHLRASEGWIRCVPALPRVLQLGSGRAMPAAWASLLALQPS